MNKTHHLICAHAAVVYVLLVWLGLFMVAGWLPPVTPATAGDHLVAMFDHDRMRIRIGMTIFAAASMFWWPFSAAIAVQMKRIEGKYPIFAATQLAAASGIVLITLFAAYYWLVAAYRPDTPAGVVQVFSDYAWLTFVGCYPPGLMQSLTIGICILTGKTAFTVYPRWVGYANLWISVIYLPGGLAPFFHNGPLAWNGALTFWTVAAAFFSYILMMWWMTVKAIKQTPDLPVEAETPAVLQLSGELPQ
jgi:hypothetical protein